MTSQRRTFELSISHSQFYLEPEHPPYADYWHDRRESDQEFSSFPLQAAVGTPNETYKCEVRVEFLPEAPDLENSVQAVCFPITVGEEGRMFLRTVIGAEEDGYHFDIPPGKHDVLVRFFRSESDPESAEVGLRAWRVELGFLPEGTMAAGTYRREYGNNPSEVILNAEARGRETKDGA